MRRPTRTSVSAAVLSATVGLSVGLAAQAQPLPTPDVDFIVFLQPELSRTAPQVANTARSVAAPVHGTVIRTFTALGAFVVRAPADAHATLRRSSSVASVSRDRPLTAPATPVETSTRQDVDARWGLDRINQRALPLDRNYRPDGDGQGVTVYVVDSGIRPTHREFAGRLRPGYNAADGGGPVTSDSSGHGTHTASIAAGASYGVASKATIVPVQVFGKKPSTTSVVVAGIDWILQNTSGPAVANMSLGWDRDDALNAATSRLVAKGISAVIAAGNDNEDACTRSPAGVKEALTVASGHTEDDISGSSAQGPCVDLYAPGAWITAASAGSDTGVTRTSGTSNAAPHVAGAVAVRLAQQPTLTPAQLHQLIVDSSTKGVLKKVPANTANALLYVGPL